VVTNRTYEFYKNLFKDQSMPLAYVDMDLLDKNIEDLLKRAGNKKIRIASKSIRCRYILEYILQSHAQFDGIMCYTAGEAAWLASEGFDNLLIGYPCANIHDLQLLVNQVAKGKKIIAMVDHVEQANMLNNLAQAANVKVPICLDIDMSTDFPRMHFGVFRSPLHTLDDVKKIVSQLKTLSHISIHGIMGYEAQVAGLGDNIEGARVKNRIVKRLKKRSNKDYKKRRGEIVSWLSGEGYQLELVNAGGTGSLELSCEEPWVTEVTIGSGFYSPGLFDHYENFKHLPAVGFVLQIVRLPKNEYFTCLGGGYIASGETGIIKQPYPYLPAGVNPIKNEGFGEVQTPFKYQGNIPLKIGDPVFFRHAKAGELCEHFNYISVVKNNTIAQQISTYRGDGKSFL
jgi:D-serine deaminase-like pyridoxal phosphate-dependent protein